MQFLTGLFGGSGTTAITAILALGIVLVLIVLGLWLLKLVFRASSTVGRGRNRRISVVDSMMLDTKRQLLIVRRDNVEHLILTGGPQDVVVETGIPVEVHPARPLPRRSPAPPVTPPQRAANSVLPPARARRAEPEIPAAAERPTSLRHTGLMRPASVQNPENNAEHAADSARTAADSDMGHAAGEGNEHLEQYRPNRTADSN